ncbi:MAG: hypothetical protein J6X29_03275 [Clostridia bacterium]|nr:hypothetical protein [Clostridia bacterium]
MKVRAYAKINLSLDITGKKGHLHTLDSLMASISLFDELSVELSDKIEVNFFGAEIGKDNTAFRAAELVKRITGKSLKIDIKKNIPIGGGLGGSSADAAAVLWCAEKMFDVSLEGHAIEIGSDVLFMMKGGFGRVSGCGDKLEEAPFRQMDILLIDCGSVSTEQCYKVYDESLKRSANSTNKAIKALRKGASLEDIISNDLLVGAEKLNSSISLAFKAAEKEGEKLFLSGSGGCLFSLSASASLEEKIKGLGLKTYRVKTTCRGVEEI